MVGEAEEKGRLLQKLLIVEKESMATLSLYSGIHDSAAKDSHEAMVTSLFFIQILQLLPVYGYEGI
jgi:hypothetical protein